MAYNTKKRRSSRRTSRRTSSMYEIRSTKTGRLLGRAKKLAGVKRRVTKAAKAGTRVSVSKGGRAVAISVGSAPKRRSSRRRSTAGRRRRSGRRVTSGHRSTRRRVSRRRVSRRRASRRRRSRRASRRRAG